MKKFLALGALALAVAAVSQQQASAWKSHSLSFGLNWSSASGGNNLLWGLYRNGQPGGCEQPNFPKHYYAVQHGYQPYGNGHGFQPFGNGHGYEGSFPAPFTAPAPAPFTAPAPAPVPAPAPAAGPQAYYYSPSFSGNYYMPVNWYGR